MSDASRALKQWRKKHGKSKRGAAKEIGVAHPSFIAWEDDEAIPSASYKEAIELVTEGAVPQTLWPLSRAERRAQRALNQARRERQSARVG